jgi:hypothetical protein
VDLVALVALETAVWQALVDGDAAADERLLADDFVGVTPRGLSDRDGHVGQLESGPTVRAFELSEARLVVVSDSAAMLIYRAVYERVGADTGSESMYVGSLWCTRGGEWRNVFSQDTPDTGLAVV